MSRSWIGCGALAVVVAGSAAVPAAVAAPPVISGADGDAWSTTPVYVVTGDATGVVWGWNVRSNLLLRTGNSGSSPFAVRPTGLRDGEYVLQVVQRNRPGVGPPTESAERRFVVDTLAPKRLEVLGPTTVAEGSPAQVSWAGGEPGAVFTWSVIIPGRPSDDDDDDDDDGDDDPRDVLVQGPVDTSAASTAITGLVPGAYEVLVTQRDRAGNVSPVARLPLAVGPAPVVALGSPPALGAVAAPSPTALAPRALRLPARNPARLRPGRATTVRVVRPVLRWRKGPAGTTFYNVQLFRVRSTRPGVATASAVGLRKVSSVFPRTTRVRARTLARGGCYVWRVWPYRAGRYTPSPLGVSHFCVSRVTAPR